jgi:[NiFe] hydrogenase assembly HybE family chaperone
MNDPASPADLLVETFTAIQRERMTGVPLVNGALSVEAVDFAPWSHHWLGVLVTPWFMNLLLMPREAERWVPVRPGDTLNYAFPAGVFGFISGREPRLGEYHACSLFSPMFEFADQETARVAASAARAALFDTGNREQAPEASDTARPARPMTKRDFLHLPGHGSGR